MRSAALFPVVKCVEVYACQIDRLTKAQNGQISSPQNTWGYSCEVVAKSYPIRIVIQFSRCNEKTFHLFPLGSAELSGVFEKISLFCKRPLHSFGQRVLKCTPIFGLFPKKLFPPSEFIEKMNLAAIIEQMSLNTKEIALLEELQSMELAQLSSR